MSRDEQLTPQSLAELATRVVVIRAWKKWEGGSVLRIELVALGKRIEPPPPLIHVCYEAGLPLNEDRSFLEFPPTISVEKLKNWTPKVQKILDSWKKQSPDLCVGLSAFACHILSSGRVAEIPVGRLYLVFHYIRLRTLLGARLEAKRNYDGDLSPLIDRFDSFIQQRIKELEQLGKMFIVS